MQIKDVISVIEEFAPLSFQEDYDNSGLQIGDVSNEIKSVLITVDITEEIIDEAINLEANLIISHHPLIFSGIKKITAQNSTEKAIIKAIQNNISIYSAHTNIDNIENGVNGIIANKIGLLNQKILQPKRNALSKLVTFVPIDHIDKVREAVFVAGAGNIGNYDSCSFNIEGTGTFKGNEDTNPFVGNKGELHKEKEIRFESIFPNYLKNKIINSLIKAHPYEEVAYDIYPLTNLYSQVGSGIIGELENEINEVDFLNKIKNIFNSGCIRHT
ncbi:Nif3-like dinuclear metal center hexameric protein, partial [Bacteroidota bacterium]